MAIAEMSKASFALLKKDENALFDAFMRVGAVEIRSAAEVFPEETGAEAVPESAGQAETAVRENSGNAGAAESGSGRNATAAGAAFSPPGKNAEEKDRAIRTVELIREAVQSTAEKADKKAPKEEQKPLTAAEFLAAGARTEDPARICRAVEELNRKRLNLAADEAKLQAEINLYLPYRVLKNPFSFYTGTAYTEVRLGTLPQDKKAAFFKEWESAGLPGGAEEITAEPSAAPGGKAQGAESMQTSDGEAQIVLLAMTEKDRAAEMDKLLGSFSFTACQTKENVTAQEKLKELYALKKQKLAEEKAAEKEIAAFAPSLSSVETYADYLSYLAERAASEAISLSTGRTLFVETYIPTEKMAAVEKEVRASVENVYIESAPVPRDEFAPTLMKNKKAVKNFEVITDMYSVPAYGALDPNGAMSIFFSFFMGFIMGDAGYGLLMMLGGFLLAARRKRDDGLSRMAKVFGYGGIFAVAFGALFDSWFGFPILRNTLGAGYNAFYDAHLDAIKAQVSLAGINIPSMLLWCLGFGSIHLAAGLVLKAVQSFSRKRYAEGIFGGLVWAAALVSLVLWVFGLVKGIEPLSAYGGYATAGLAVFGILTAGVTEKGAGKILKPFTSAYGLINYVSDILSYARLYGLMLSGAQIASIFTNTLAIGMLFPKGPVGVAFGILVIVIGNLFNLAMSLLGAYIHDSRLQYVEFFGKFYEGEGEPFRPFGRQTSFVRIDD